MISATNFIVTIVIITTSGSHKFIHSFIISLFDSPTKFKILIEIKIFVNTKKKPDVECSDLSTTRYRITTREVKLRHFILQFSLLEFFSQEAKRWTTRGTERLPSHNPFVLFFEMIRLMKRNRFGLKQ